MPGKTILCLICGLSLTFACIVTAPKAALAVESVSDEMLLHAALYDDLVVRGVLTEFGYIKLPLHHYLGSIADSDGAIRVLEIGIRVSEALAGECSDTTLSFLVPEGRIGPIIDGRDSAIEKLRIGDPIVAMLTYDLYDLGCYILRPGPSFFRIENNRLISYNDRYSLDSIDPIRTIRQGSASRSFEAISRTADLVCIATLLSNDTRGRILTLRVNQVLKGKIPPQTIQLDYRGDFAMWEGKGPTLLLFLKPRDKAYTLSSGANSVYTVLGDMILRNRLPLVTTLPMVKMAIKLSRGED